MKTESREDTFFSLSPHPKPAPRGCSSPAVGLTRPSPQALSLSLPTPLLPSCSHLRSDPHHFLPEQLQLPPCLPAMSPTTAALTGSPERMFQSRKLTLSLTFPKGLIIFYVKLRFLSLAGACPDLPRHLPVTHAPCTCPTGQPHQLPRPPHKSSFLWLRGSPLMLRLYWCCSCCLEGSPSPLVFWFLLLLPSVLCLGRFPDFLGCVSASPLPTCTFC